MRFVGNRCSTFDVKVRDLHFQNVHFFESTFDHYGNGATKVMRDPNFRPSTCTSVARGFAKVIQSIMCNIVCCLVEHVMFFVQFSDAVSEG